MNRMRTSLAAVLGVAFGVLPLVAAAQVPAGIPRTISYQGAIAENGVAVSGSHSITVALYDAASGGTALFSEIQHVTIGSDGVFSLVIGSSNALILPFDRPYYLAVSVDGGSELSPRIPLSSAPYALTAGTAEVAHGLTPVLRYDDNVNEATASRRIYTKGLSNITLGQYGAATLIYDAGLSRWIVISTN